MLHKRRCSRHSSDSRLIKQKEACRQWGCCSHAQHHARSANRHQPHQQLGLAPYRQKQSNQQQHRHLLQRQSPLRSRTRQRCSWQRKTSLRPSPNLGASAATLRPRASRPQRYPCLRTLIATSSSGPSASIAPMRLVWTDSCPPVMFIVCVRPAFFKPLAGIGRGSSQRFVSGIDASGPSADPCLPACHVSSNLPRARTDGVQVLGETA